MNKPTFGSLFTGIGGLDLGLERSGWRCAWQVEIDRQTSSVLDARWPDVKKYEDVRNVGKKNLESVDLVCGGFPCQDVSIAGKRKGLAGERSGLWFEFARIIDELEPRWIVIENVPGLLSSNGGRDFAAIVRWLAERGYGVAWRVLDAQYFRVPQRRRRVFIVASFGDGRAAEVLFEREGVSRDSAPRRETKEDVADPITASFARNRGCSAGNDSSPHNLIIAPLKAQPPSRRNGGSSLISDEFIIVPSLSAHCPRYNGSEEMLIEVYRTRGTVSGRVEGASEGVNDAKADTQCVLVGALQSHSPRHGHAMSTQQAWDLFTSSPLIGRGPYAMLTAEHGIFHALNLPLTVAIDSGLLGLGALGLGAWRAACAKRTRWANAALLGWLAFQMAEDTFWFISVGLLVMILLAGKE